MGGQVMAVHKESIIIDGLNISLWDEDTFLRLRRGGLTAINATVAVLENFRQTVQNISAWYRRFEQYTDLIMPVRSVADIYKAKELGKAGIIFGFQNTSPIEEDLHLLSIFKELGVRVIQLVYFERNFVGDGSTERTNCGLSQFGIEVIEEMNRLGILIDLSHVGDQTTCEAIEFSEQPVTFSHANPRSLCPHPRNKTDEQLKFLASKGGVVGANIYPPFLPRGYDSTLDDFVDVIDYLVELVGIDHVAIGSDLTEGQPWQFFEWIYRGRCKKKMAMTIQWPLVYPEGFQSAADFPNVTRKLIARGYEFESVKKIVGGNLLRLYGEVWKA